jgi:hypothetical protein
MGKAFGVFWMAVFNHSIADSFTVDGSWWLPSDPDKKIPGKLEFRPGEALGLDLFGSFEKTFAPFDITDRFNPSVVNGVSIDGVDFTLLSCSNGGSNWNLSLGYGKTRYHVRSAISGARFGSLDELKIKECSFGLSLLEEWIGKHPFGKSFLRFQDGKVTLQVDFESETFFSFELPQIAATISATEYVGTGKDFSTLRKLSYDRKGSMIVKPDEPKDLLWFREVIVHIRNIFYLFTGLPFDVIDIKLTADNPEESDQEYFGGDEVRLSLFYRQKSTLDKGSDRRDYPFPFTKLSSRELEQVFASWFEKKDRLETLLSLFFGEIRDPNENWELGFLTLMQAIETYHRTISGGLYLEQSEYDEKVLPSLVQAIPFEVQKDLRDSLKKRLQFGNEHSLRKRLKCLLEGLDDGCRSLITTEPATFLKKVVDTRNYFTHYSTVDPDQDVLEGADLINVRLQLRLLIFILLLKEIGFSEDRIASALAGKNHVVSFGYSEVTYSPSNG